jgi:hypothetical protein
MASNEVTQIEEEQAGENEQESGNLVQNQRQTHTKHTHTTQTPTTQPQTTQTQTTQTQTTQTQTMIVAMFSITHAYKSMTCFADNCGQS